MANEFKISEIVDKQALEDVIALKTELVALKGEYVVLTRELGKKLTLNISSFKEYSSILVEVNTLMKDMADKEAKMSQVGASYAQAVTKTAQAMEKSVAAQQKQNQTSAQTTNTISRELAEIEKVNAKKREEFVLDEKAVEVANSILGTRKANTESLVMYQQTLDSIKQAKKEVNQLEADGVITNGEAVAKLAELVAEERSVKVAMQETQTILKNQEKLSQDASGSYTELSHQLELMKKAYKQLNDEEKNGENGKILANQIQNLDAHLKDLAADMGEFQRNVGNYAIANGGLKKELRELVMNIADLTAQYRALNDEEKKGEFGVELASRLQTMTERASTLKDVISDVNAEISAGASDTSRWDAVAGQLGILTAGFAAATAAGKAFGLEEEELNEVQASALVVLGLANNAKQISNSLEKQSAVMVGISTVKNAAATKAIALKAAAEGKGAIATKAATVAQAAFNLVAKANPYVLLATAIVTVVGALTAFVIGTRKSKDATAEANRELERMNNELNRIKSNSDFDVQIAEAAGKSTEEIHKMRLEAAKAANDLAYLELQSAQKKFYNGEIGKEELQKFIDAEKETYDKVANILNEGTVMLIKAQKKQEEERRKAAEDAAKARMDAEKKANEEAEAAAKAHAEYLANIDKQLAESEIAIMEEGREKEVASIQAKYKERMDAITGETENEIKLRQNLQVEMLNAIQDINEKYDEKEAQALREASEKRMKIVDDEAKHRADAVNDEMANEMLKLKESYSKREITEEQYNQKVSDIRTKYAAKSSKVVIDYLRDILKSENLTQDERVQLEQMFAEKWREYEDSRLQATIDANEKIKRSNRESMEKAMDDIDQAAQLIDTFSAFGEQLYQNQIDKIQEMQDAIDARYEKEMDMLERMEENGSVSAEEAEARKRAAADRTAQEKEKLAKRQEELEKKQARLAKSNAIAQTIISTALAVTKALPNYILAGLVAATGAAQLATIMATPAYKEGTRDHKGGMAIVGDGGKPEVIFYKGQSWVTPSVPTLVDMPKHSQVFKDMDTYQKMRPHVTSDFMSLSRSGSDVKVVNDFTSLQKSVEKGSASQTSLLRQLLRQGREKSFDSYIKSRM